MKRLECEDHVLTVDSEDSASEIRKQLTTDVKRQKLLAEAKKFKVSIMSTNNDDSECLKINENKSDMKKGKIQIKYALIIFIRL